MNLQDTALIEHPDILFGPVRPDLLRDEVLADLLESTAKRIPNHPALIFGDRQLSYQELDEQADHIASALIEAGVRPGEIIGLWMPRGIDLLIMQAGISKAGAAWLPFDADVPLERITVCLQDAQAIGIICDDQHTSSFTDGNYRVWGAQTLATTQRVGPLRRREDLLPSHIAYVIYTSGSTGKPKGIAISHRSVCNFLRGENSVLGVNGDDRVYQGFSVAFDMSFDEIWMSYLVGATQWIAPRELASDPEALPAALAANHVTVLHTVPTLLSLFAADVPTLRLINLGGEACPENLVERWARPGRQIFNGYGPTETAVGASQAELHVGDTITIGHPLPNYGMLIIDTAVEDGLKLMPRGEVGELCITGPGLAVGYLGRPQLTAEKFLQNPWANSPAHTHLYRTGDLARITPDNCVQCLGRADDQVKIRGFRVELGEIEAVLLKQEGVGTAAVALRKEDGIDQLIVFIVADGKQVPTAKGLRAALAEKLPPYMVPGRFEMIDAMPRLASGKIDRNVLKARSLSVQQSEGEESDLPTSAAEEALFAILSKLFPGQAIRRQADFFADLGGHSFFAARLASMLRTDARFAHITVRDIYQHRTVGNIAACLEETQAKVLVSDDSWTPPSALRRWSCGIAQMLAIPVLVTMRMAQWLAPFFTYHYFTGDPTDSIPNAIAFSVGVFLLAIVIEFSAAICGKWLIAGKLRPGRYPLWGVTYFRWWLADRLVESAPAYLLTGSSLYVWWLRALGARIGYDTMIGSVTLRSPDLIDIGDYVSIGNGVNFENARIERGELWLGQIRIADNASIGSYAVLEGNTTIGSYGHLEGQSSLSDGTVIPEKRTWTGSPARDIGPFDPIGLPKRVAVSRLRLTMEAIYFILTVLFIATLFFMPIFPSFVLIDWIDEIELMPWLLSDDIPTQLARYFLLAFPASAVLVLCTMLVSAAIRWSILPRLKPGSWPIHSNVYCGKWLVSQIQESSLNVLHGIYATVYAPFWYRLLGAKVGRDAELSTALGVVPDMLTVGDETFVADAVLLGDEQVDGGWITMQPTHISHRSFVGNGAYIPDGSILPENVLIGVHSRAPSNDRMRNGDTWLGTPPINLPAREQVSGYPESLTFRPSPLRRIGRGVVEALRIAAPHAVVIAVGYTLVLDIMPLAAAGQWLDVIWDLSIAGFWYGIGSFAFVALFKWLIIGRYQKRAEPMWTPFVWFSEGITNIYEGIAVPNFMSYLRGTPWLPLAFNLLGCRIGRGVYLDTTDITEFDCVSIGEYSELNGVTSAQTHLFEDRVMKIDHIKIGARVYMGPRSAVLYSAEIGDNAKLGPLTLVMKGEHIPASSVWSGCPAAPVKA